MDRHRQLIGKTNWVRRDRIARVRIQLRVKMPILMADFEISKIR